MGLMLTERGGGPGSFREPCPVGFCIALQLTWAFSPDKHTTLEALVRALHATGLLNPEENLGKAASPLWGGLAYFIEQSFNTLKYGMLACIPYLMYLLIKHATVAWT